MTARAAPDMRALALAMLAMLGGCASSPPEPSRVEREAVGVNQRAARAFQQGNLAQARSLYEEALKLDVAIENAEGIAVNLLSLARIEQAAGNAPAAHALLDRLLSDAPLALPRARHAEAAARKAQLHLSARETARAAEWAARAETLCPPACPARAAALNLRALAAFDADDPAAAAELAQRAVGAATGDDGRAERANGQRLLGEARLARNESAAAHEALREALSLDQALGLPGRIFRDLMLLGQAAEKLGRREEARGYFARALAVGAAQGDGAAQRLARAQLDRF
jgi:tetratricopeptide (TPR) repeat protein